MTDFKVGDRVRLTGDDWYGGAGSPEKGDIVEITRVDADFAFFERSDGEWYIEEGGYDAELVTSAEERQADDDTTVEKLDAINPDHYRFGKTQVIDITRHLGFLEGNVVKYVTRAGRKGDRLEDLKKAAQYLQWAIEDAEERA